MTAHSMAQVDKYSANQSTIDGLTQLTCLAMLELQRDFEKPRHKPIISKKNQQIWGRLLNPENLRPLTGPLVIAICIEAREAKEEDEAVKKIVRKLTEEQSEVLVAMSELLRSQVFRGDEL